MDYVNMKMLSMYERILGHADPNSEDPVLVEGRQYFKDLQKRVDEDMREHLEILEGCCEDATEPPWCAFSDDGKVFAVMAAGRPFDVFKFEEPPKEADAHYLLLTQPHVVQAMIERIRKLEAMANIGPEHRWTGDLKEVENERGKSDGTELAELAE